MGFDPTATGFGGMCSFFSLKDQHPVLTRRRALFLKAEEAIYERWDPDTAISSPTGISLQTGISPKGFNEDQFIRYLQNTCNSKTVKERLFYAKKYRHVLDTGNASDILSLIPEQRNRVMKALALLAKFHGCYDQWKAIRQKYDIKWASEPATAVFNRIISNTDPSYGEMVKWIKTMLKVLPPSYGNVVLFTTLTGLRANESLASVKLIKTDLDHYLNNGILEHFRYPDSFIRRTKKAFISIVPDNLIDLANSCQDVNYEGFRAYLKRRGYSTDLKYCRCVFATYLRTKGIEQETIDLLQGRVPKSVFARHYYKPTLDYGRIRELILQLANDMKCVD